MSSFKSTIFILCSLFLPLILSQSVNQFGIMRFMGSQGFANLVQDSTRFGSLAFNSSQGMLFNQRNRQQCANTEMRGHFPCQQLSPTPSPPTSVHRLRPGDIRVIAAMGDSITAGTGALAEDVKQILTEYAGVSFSIGGESRWDKYLTLPNVLKNFNPNLYGYSIGIRGNHRGVVGLNLAETGGTAKDLIGQAHRLVAKMRADPHVDVKRDWKMVTVLVGHNDVCSHACERFDLFGSPEAAGAKDYVAKLTKALDILHYGLPRTFVNLLPIANLYGLREMYDKPLPCVFTHLYGCPCLFDDKFSDKLNKRQFFGVLNSYLRGLRDLVDSGRYDSRPDFTVVIQPTLVKADVPKYRPRRGARLQPNPDYLAPDCFHWAQKSHAKVARGLWNNLLQPVGSKTSAEFEHTVPFLCPSEEFPYLATAKNSRGGNGSTSTSLMRDFEQMMDIVGRNMSCPF